MHLGNELQTDDRCALCLLKSLLRPLQTVNIQKLLFHLVLNLIRRLKPGKKAL